MKLILAPYALATVVAAGMAFTLGKDIHPLVITGGAAVSFSGAVLYEFGRKRRWERRRYPGPSYEGMSYGKARLKSDLEQLPITLGYLALVVGLVAIAIGSGALGKF